MTILGFWQAYCDWWSRHRLLILALTIIDVIGAIAFFL